MERKQPVSRLSYGSTDAGASWSATANLKTRGRVFTLIIQDFEIFEMPIAYKDKPHKAKVFCFIHKLGSCRCLGD